MADYRRKQSVALGLLFGLLAGLILATEPQEALGASAGFRSLPSTSDNSATPLISDSLFLYAASVLDFDVQVFLNSQPGPLATYTENVSGQTWTAAESIQYVATFYGLNPQLILTLLEAQGQLLSSPEAAVPKEASKGTDPAVAGTFYGHVKQLAEGALLAYDGHRYGDALTELILPSGEVFSPVEPTNAGTYAVQVALARSMAGQEWASWVQGPRPLFVERFDLWFGDPLLELDQDLPAATTAPTGYMLPFPVGETWYYTGGPHYYGGGTPGCISGASCPRPWSSLDIAQPELIGCPGGSYPAQRWIVAAKSGQVIQSSQALVVIDHGDGWRTYYSHVSTADRRGLGPVERGDRLGHPSCEVQPGGYTTGIHVHFGLYQVGIGFVNVSGATFSGWLVGETSHYNGTMSLGDELRVASTGRYAGYNDLLNGGVGGFCPTSGGVLLYKHINFDCDGSGPGNGYIQQTSAGFQDLPASFNDQASSIRVPPGWSVRLYEHTGRAGASVCRNADDASFSGDFFEGSAMPLNDQVSSIEVFENDDCSGPYEGGQWSVTIFSDTELATPCETGTQLEGGYVFQDWGADSPAETCPADHWSARFVRYAYFPAGSYTFGLSSDDWSRLKIDDQVVVDNWQGAGQHSSSRTLVGGSHKVTVEYADLLDSAYLAAWWWGQGYNLPHESQDNDQWFARYWANRELEGDPVLMVNEGGGLLNHAWAAGGPGYGLPADHFSGRFERWVLFPCGSYRFQLHTDDGARFRLDGELLLEAWYDQVGDHELQIDLDSGIHHLEVEHYENGGGAAISLGWTHLSFCPLPNAIYFPFIGQKAGR